MKKLVVNVDWMQANPHWVGGLDTHAWNEFLYVVQGTYSITQNRQTLKGRAGDVIFVRKGVAHSSKWAMDGTSQIALISLHPKLKLSTGHALKLKDQNGRLISLLAWAWTLIDGTKRDNDTLDLLARLFTKEHLRLSAVHPEEQNMVHKAIRIMNACLTNRSGMDELIRVLGVSQPTLYRAFVEAKGISPKQYMNRIRAEKVLHLLKSSQMPLRGIAVEIGLTDPNSVSRLLKRELGIKPTQIRPRKRA